MLQWGNPFVSRVIRSNAPKTAGNIRATCVSKQASGMEIIAVSCWNFLDFENNVLGKKVILLKGSSEKAWKICSTQISITAEACQQSTGPEGKSE